MHDQRGGPGKTDQGGVNLITAQLLDSFARFGFLAHRDPNVGIEQIGAGSGGFDVVRADDGAPGASQQPGGRLERFGRGDPQLETEFGGGKNPRVHDVTRAIADEGDDAPLNWPALFLEREDICQDLAGMLLIGERIDRRNGCVAREFLQVLLRIRSEYGPVYHSPQHPRGILDGLAAAKLALSRR